MSTILEVDNVSKSFGGLRALRECSFTIESGNATCLVGPNGAGKTTLFDVITGFLKPDSGDVRFKGQSLKKLSRRDVVKTGVARTFQNLRLFPELSVRDNVVVCLADEAGNGAATSILRPFLSNAIARRKEAEAMHLLETVGLAHKADDYASGISFGQQKLLCVARILATNADLLLLDEPTSGLAARALDNMVELIDKLRKLGKTLLVVEHNTRIVRQISNAVVFMHQGHVLRAGLPDDVLNDRALAEVYFGGAITEHAL
jgi:ABC-type branched-subunit amino acid transport system ATPase component